LKRLGEIRPHSKKPDRAGIIPGFQRYNVVMDARIAEGIRLFNTQKFFEAHEALEAVWLGAEGDEKMFLHGLIQIAAAFHHHSRGNIQGFRSLLDKGFEKLNAFGESRGGINLVSLRGQLQPWRALLDRAPDSAPTASPPLPHIEPAPSGNNQT
jgi:uncharacterized protein